MSGPGVPWGFGIPGFRELILIALVTLALYGRSGLAMSKSPYLRLLRPWADTPRRRATREQPQPPTAPRGFFTGDRLYWFLAIIAATAVAAWIVTRAFIVAAPGASH